MPILFRGNSVEQERVLNAHSTASSQRQPKYCHQNSTYLVTVILLGVLSTAMTCVVWYLVLGVQHQCECSYSEQHIRDHHSTNHNFTVVFNDLKRKLQRDIDDLTNKMSNLSTKVGDDKKTPADLHDANYQKTVEKQLNGLYNQTEEKLARLFQQTNAQVDTIIELNNKPNCLFQQRKEIKNSTLVTVHVPKSAEDRITVVVTCSTTLQNTADVRYMVPASDNGNEYICYCRNDINKLTDCVAYYWQCRL